jgi:predicted enzyme related to lactoylglutathione lyase
VLTTMIFAKDHDAMVAFYRSGFALHVDTAASSDGYTVLTGAMTRVSIHALPPHIAAGITIAEPPQPRSEGAVKLLFEVAAFEATCERLVGLGGQLFETTTDDASDGCDVEGNVFRVSSTATT